MQRLASLLGDQCTNVMQITDIFALKTDANDWHVYWMMHKYCEKIMQMIGMFSQEEDGVTIWGPARGRSPLPQQVAAIYLL